MNHAENTGTQGVGKISWFVGLPKVKASLRLMVGLPVGLGLKPLLSSGLVLKIYGRHISQEGDGELEGVSRDLGDAAGSGKDCGDGPKDGRVCGYSGRTARVGGWNGTALIGAVPLKFVVRIHRERLVFPLLKQVRTSQRTSCLSTIKTSSDLTENSCVSTTKIISNLSQKVVLQPQKPIRTSQRKPCFNQKTSSNLTESVLCFHHKSQFEPHRESLVFPT